MDDSDPQSQYNLGWCHRVGNGVKQDYGEAVKCWRKAAEQGFAMAQDELRMLE